MTASTEPPLWKSDGTSAGTVLLKAYVNPTQLTRSSNAMYFVANDVYCDRELWKCDGTEAGTMPVDVHPPILRGALVAAIVE